MTAREGPTPVTIAFGQRVRELRKARGWSQREMAPMIPLGNSALGRIEQGEGTTLATAGRIAGVFGMPLAGVLNPAPPEAGDLEAAR